MMALPMAAPALEPELDSALLERCRAGDPLAFRAFVVRFQGPVFALLSRVLGRGPHVDDLAQETFLKAYRGLPGFDPKGPAKLSTWLFTIATRLAIDAVRRRRVSERLFVEGLEATERSDSQAATARARKRLEDALSAFREMT